MLNQADKLGLCSGIWSDQAGLFSSVGYVSIYETYQIY